MKNFYFASVILTIVFFVSGCTSLILDAYKKIEPISFEVKPPTKNEFTILIPDEQVANAIIGDWVCQGSCKGFSKLDINGKPFIFGNGGVLYFLVERQVNFAYLKIIKQSHVGVLTRDTEPVFPFCYGASADEYCIG